MGEVKFLFKAYKKMFSDYIRIINRELEGCHSVLVVGCGKGWSEQFLDFNDRYIAGVDIVEPYYKPRGFWNRADFDEFHLYDIKNGLLKKFKQNSFDCVMALELIEHLEKKEALKAIEEMEKIAFKKVILLTPNGFQPSKKEEVEENIYMEHLSSWQAEELLKLNYRVIGVKGWRRFYDKTLLNTNLIMRLFANISSLVLKNPDKASEMVAIKSLHEKARKLLVLTSR